MTPKEAFLKAIMWAYNQPKEPGAIIKDLPPDLRKPLKKLKSKDVATIDEDEP